MWPSLQFSLYIHSVANILELVFKGLQMKIYYPVLLLQQYS
jgi:hypothetical protein